MTMFTEDQLTNALNAYGTSASTHVARLIALADMRENANATLEDITVAIRHAAACRELGVPFNDTSASTLRAVERLTGYSESTFQRYNVVLEWLSASLSDGEYLVDILDQDTFSADALSALVQLASGKVATRKMASDTVATHIVKRDSEKIVSAYRRLLSATNAKAKAKRERVARAKSETKDATPATTERTPEQILADLSIPAMAELLMTRIASSGDELTPDDYTALVDTIAGIGAMLEELANN